MFPSTASSSACGRERCPPAQAQAGKARGFIVGGIARVDPFGAAHGIGQSHTVIGHIDHLAIRICDFMQAMGVVISKFGHIR